MSTEQGNPQDLSKRTLPVFKGCEVDEYFQHFRVKQNGAIFFIPFDSPRGQELLQEYLRRE